MFSTGFVELRVASLVQDVEPPLHPVGPGQRLRRARPQVLLRRKFRNKSESASHASRGLQAQEVGSFVLELVGSAWHRGQILASHPAATGLSLVPPGYFHSEE